MRIRWEWSAPLLAGALVLWLALGAATPWCLDDGLRLLAGTGPSMGRVAELDAVLNHAGPQVSSPFKAPLYPVVEPFVDWRGQGPVLVFPPLQLALLWLFSRLGSWGPALLAVLSALALAGSARALWRTLDRQDPARPRNFGWLAALTASPALFYLGTSWEFTLATALLLLLLRERRAPWPAPVAVLHGLLPWLRPELLLFTAGGLFLLKGWLRRGLALAGFLAGLLFHHWLTGSWIWLQVPANFQAADPSFLANLYSFWLPAADMAWLVPATSLLMGLLAARRWPRLEIPVLAAWAVLLAALLARQAGSDDQLLPSYGVLAVAPLAVWALLRGLSGRDWRDSWPELGLLVLFLAFVTLASPVNLGFHWGPRLLVPALAALGLWGWAAVPAGWSRRLLLGLGVAVQLVSVLLLAGRRELVRAQDARLADLRAPVLATTEVYLVGDHPFLAAGRTILRPFGEKQARSMSLELQAMGVKELDVVARPGHPLPILLVKHLEWTPWAPPETVPGSRLGAPLVLHRLRRPE